MSSPPQRPPSAAVPTATSPPPTTATQPLPLPRAFLATSSPRRASPTAAPAPPPPLLFTGRPLNPNPSHAPAAHGILYPIATSSATIVGNQRRAPPVAVGFPRAHAVAVPIAQPQQSPVPAHPRSFAAVPRAVVSSVVPRPEQPPRGVPIASQAQPKVNPVPAVSPSLQEHSNSKDKETTKEDSTTVVINDRKVNLLDSESGSLYTLCRSWVRNGIPQDSQPTFGNDGPSLPKPLPASVVDSRISEKDDVEEESKEDKGPLSFILEQNSSGHTTNDLLKQHVNRAKKIRAGLQRERLRRIERYKQRLALLLPPPSELGRHDSLP